MCEPLCLGFSSHLQICLYDTIMGPEYPQKLLDGENRDIYFVMSDICITFA